MGGLGDSRQGGQDDGEVVTAYVTVEQGEMVVGGAAFRINPFPSSLLVLDVSYPPGLVIGDIFSGVEIGITDPIPQFGEDRAVVATIDVMALGLTSHEIFPMSHPSYPEPMVAHYSGAYEPAVPWPGTVEVILNPQAGLFFDPEGSGLDGTFVGGPGETATVWLMMRDLEESVGSLYFSLDLPPSLGIVSHLLPAGHTLLGDLDTGAILVFDPEIAAPGMTGVVLAEVVLSLGDVSLTEAVMTLGGHQDYGGGPMVVKAPLGAYPVDALESRISIPIGNESRSWSAVKTLYR